MLVVWFRNGANCYGIGVRSCWPQSERTTRLDDIYIYMLCFFAHRRPVEDISVFSCESGWFRCSSKSALLAPPANFVYSHQSLALELAALFSRDSIRAETGVYATLKTGICWRFSSKYNLIQEFTSNAVSRHQSD